MPIPHINYWAVLVSGVVIFILGGLWYSRALFAKPWIRLMGKSEEEMKAASGPMPLLLLMAFISGLIIAASLAVVIRHLPPVTPLRGALVGVFCWVGFAAATSLATALFSSQPKRSGSSTPGTTSSPS